jgi:Flp pilus assembly pilin Flp
MSQTQDASTRGKPGITAFRGRRGASLLGYALAVGLISVAALFALSDLGDSVTALFGNVDESLVTATEAATGGGGDGDDEGDGANQAPAAPGLSATSIQENNTAGAVVGTITAVDPDGDTVTFSLASGGDNDFFQISGNQLQASGIFNYEVPQDADTGNTYAITIIATDDGSPQEDSQANFTITVTDDGADIGPSGQSLCGGVFNPVRGTPPAQGGPGCDDGTGAIYAGHAPDGQNFFVAHCDIGMSSTGSGCTGSRSIMAWNEASITTYNDTSVPNVAAGGSPNVPSSRYGGEVLGATSPQTVTQFLADPQGAGADADAGEAGLQPHTAAKACFDLVAHGTGPGTWYLPGIGELDVIYANLVSTDDPEHPLPTVGDASYSANAGTTGPLRDTFVTTGTPYWSSSEPDDVNAAYYVWMEIFNNGRQLFDNLKSLTNRHVRCARR